jgi:hypothetical protein
MVALGGIGVTVILALLVIRMVQRMVLKVVLVGALVGAGFYVYAQRTELTDCVPQCACTFFGFDVKVDASVCDSLPLTKNS